METESEEITLSKLAQDYSDETKARALLESWVWPDGPVCPHCRGKDACRLAGKSTRAGVLRCRGCGRQFTVTVGTIFERSKIPISKWMMAVFILSSSKKGMSAHQLHRMLDVTYKTAWFIFHRLRHAVKQIDRELMTGTVEADDVYIGGTPEKGKGTAGRGTKHKTAVVALVERGGNARLQVVAGVSAGNLRKFVADVVDPVATINTDQWKAYSPLFRGFAKHEVVKHSDDEFKRHNADGSVSHVNTCESLFSLIKRGMVGSWHHVSKEHLPKYLDEFVFRWDRRKLTDGERMRELIELTPGKRLTYRETVLKSGVVK